MMRTNACSCIKNKFSAPATTVFKISSCVTALCILLLASGESQGADFSLKPSLSVSQEYTDNVYESNLNKKTDYITRAQPGLALKYTAPLWDWDLNYAFDYRYYARGSRSDETTHNVNGKGLLKLVDEVLFLELSDTYKRVSLDVTRDTTSESLYSNQTDQNVATISPYLVLHPTTKISLRTGYRYINTWYKDPTAVSKQNHVGFIKANYEISSKFFMTADYTFTRELPRRGSSFNRHEAYVGPRYEYADKSFIFAQGGVIATDYEDQRHSFEPSWRAGITHTLDTFTATATAGTSYSDDPLGDSTFTTNYALSLTKEIQRGSLTVSGVYNEYVNGDTDQTRNKSYSCSIKGSMELLSGITANLGFTYENYNNVLADAYTDKYFVDSGLSWMIGKYLVLGLNYKHINYNSAKIAEDNKRINRLILDAKVLF